MPWKENKPMDERAQFVFYVSEGDLSITELCDHFGVSRKTGYKWLKRYELEGLAGLSDRPRDPRHIPNRTKDDVIDFMVSMRGRHPSWGARKLMQLAHKKRPELKLPSETTVNNLLKREGLTTQRRRRYKPSHPGRPFTVPKEPNDIWTADFKGEFRLGDGEYCYPLTVCDEFSRQILSCKGLTSTGYVGAFKTFRRVFDEFGLPRAIKSDNGIPFATCGLARLSKLSVWWIKLGINPILIEPASPYQNGKHERMHRTLKQECTIPPRPTMKSQQYRFNEWQKEFNEDRPHEALDGKYPAEIYIPSSRCMPTREPKVEYPAHFEVRLVSATSAFRWHSRYVNASGSLIGEYVGLEEVLDGIWAVYFSWKRIGFMDERKKKILDHLGRYQRNNL